MAGVGEALASGSDPRSACLLAGEELAADGMSLDEALQHLETVSRRATGAEPDFATTRALASAWSEATLSVLHRLSCDDPLTGLSTLTHLRTRLSEVQRQVGLPGQQPVPALLVADLTDLPAATAGDPWARSLVVTRLGNAARTVFPGEETISHVARDRVVVLTRDDGRLDRRDALLQRLWQEADPSVPAGLRTRVESVPPDETGALALLDGLAHG